MTPHDTPPDQPGCPGAARLTPEDAQALDALFESGMDESGVPEAHRQRSSRVAALLGLLGRAPIDGRSHRVARVLARARTSNGAGEEVELCGLDAEALDAWVLADFDAAKVPPSLRDRARAHDALASLARSGGPVASDLERHDLISRTLDAVYAATDRHQEDAYRFRPASRARWTDLLSVAAVLLIAASILWPVLSTVRDGARRTICNGNLREVGHALGGYALDHDAMLPVTTAGFGGGTWWDVGNDPQHSNSANLYTLARERYLALSSMACPGNPQAATSARSPDARDWSSLEELSYSYRVMARPERELWGGPAQLVVVADRSPVVLRAIRGQMIYPVESSPNHRGRGQHGLFADGSSQWLASPVLPSGDNIWLPKPIEVVIDAVSRRAGLDPIQGTEAPADRLDSFVGP